MNSVQLYNLVKHLAPSKMSAAKSLYTAFQLLKENNGEMQRRELIEKMEAEIFFEAWEKEQYPSNGQIKWQTIFFFYTIDSIKTGWLVKNKGHWQLTDEGLKAANQYNAIELLEKASKGYREWRNSNPQEEQNQREDDIDIEDEQVQQATLESLETQAIESIGIYLERIPFTKFQKICVALIKAMGFYTDFEASKGPDGGVDFIAYRDELGTEKPRIKVQVKNYNSSVKVDVKEVREFKGLLNSSEHVGLFITSGYYTKRAMDFVRDSDAHIKIIDRDLFVELWKKYYSKLNEQQKSLLPLQPVYFLGKVDE